MGRLKFDDGELIQPTDFEAKFNEIFNELRRDLFDKVDINTAFYNNSGDLFDDGKKPKKQTYSRHEIAPLLTPVQVNSKLNELLRVYRPLDLDEAKAQPDTVYLTALKWYMHLITEINRYITLLPSKQTFCAFTNISVATYNELLTDPNFAQVFSSAEDYFIDSNYTSAQAGLVDTRMVTAKLQMKDSGHNQVKNPDSIGNVTVNQIDKQQIHLALEQFEAMTKGNK